MIKNIIYLVLLIVFSFAIPQLTDYPFLLMITGLGWCISAALLLYKIINYILEKTTK
jgi:hypothetical protein